MKKFKILILISSFLLVNILNAAYNQDRVVLTSTKILKDIMKAPKTGITKELLHNAKAIAIFPNTQKGAFFIGARVGKGILCVKNSNAGWSDPIFVKFKGLSIGLQFGFLATDLVVIFKTDRSLDDLASGKVTLGIDIGVVAIAKGVGGAVKTDEKLAADIQSYGKSSGGFVGVSVDGSTLNVSDNDNFDYYNSLVYLEDILTKNHIKDKEESRKLREVLDSL